MFSSFRDAPSWAQTRNPAPCTALDSGFAPSGAPRNDREQNSSRHPEERALARVSKDGPGLVAILRDAAKTRLLRMTATWWARRRRAFAHPVPKSTNCRPVELCLLSMKRISRFGILPAWLLPSQTRRPAHFCSLAFSSSARGRKAWPMSSRRFCHSLPGMNASTGSSPGELLM